MAPTRLRRRMSRLTPEHAEVGREGVGGRRVVGLDVDGAHAEVAHPAGQASAAHDGHGPSFVQADAPAEEEGRRIPGWEHARRRVEDCPRGPAEAAEAGHPPEVEDALALEEELALLREEQAEPRQVDLLLVDLHLREVGVVGEVRRQVLGQAVLHVDAAVSVAVVRDRGRDGPVGVERADRVGLDLERAAVRRHLQAHQGAGDRQAELSRSGRDRHRRQVRLLEVRPDVPAQLDAPYLVRSGPETERLERNLHFDGPAAVEAARAHVPDGIPVGIRVAFVGDLLILEAPDGVDPEGEAVAAVVEGVEDDDVAVVVDDPERVALHLVGDPLRFGDRLVDAGPHVDRLVVEEDPVVGSLRGRGPLVGGLLDEPPERLDAGVDRLVEHAVEPQGFIEPDGADRRPAAGVPIDGGRRDRRRRTIDKRACGLKSRRRGRGLAWWLRSGQGLRAGRNRGTLRAGVLLRGGGHRCRWSPAGKIAAPRARRRALRCSPGVEPPFGRDDAWGNMQWSLLAR